MDFENARRLLRTIPADAKVVDVGGGAAPFPRADYVIDAMPFQKFGAHRDGNIPQELGIEPRYSEERWIQTDLCDRRPWPIPDKSFDFAICSDVLQDVRDPMWVCSELRRIAKAGYIESPSRVVEQSKGVENPRHAGYYHHRWLIASGNQRLEFRHKPFVLHSTKDAIVTHLSPGRRIAPEHAIVTLDWFDDFESVEWLEFEEHKIIEELCAFAAQARQLPNLTIKVPAPMVQSLKRRFFYYRLWLGHAG